MHPCVTPYFIFFYELISLSTCIAADCSQCMFLITHRSFPSLFNCVSCLIISSCCTLSNASVQLMKHRITSFCTSRACSIIVQMWIAFAVPFPAQCSSAVSGLILFPTCIMMIPKSIWVMSLRKLFIIRYSHSVIPGFFWQCYKYGFGNVWWNLTCVIDFAE